MAHIGELAQWHGVAPPDDEAQVGESIRVRGLVQGVGFRPTAWRLAARYGVSGWITNDGEGVDILACGSNASLQAFCAALAREAPPLARIDAIERHPASGLPPLTDFRILASRPTKVRTAVLPDAAICEACAAEIRDPGDRRHLYAFNNCTHCGPRFSIVDSVPYDRAATTMRKFTLCARCAAEYRDPENRRFHAEPIACPVCGPRVWLEHSPRSQPMGGLPADAIAAARWLIQHGRIVAVKGLGGFQLACDACDEQGVARLRRLKVRPDKPFALMARDLTVVRRYCLLSEAEALLLRSTAAPIVLLRSLGALHPAIAASVAPRMTTHGVMLPNSPLHQLLLAGLDRPMVLTSGNRSEEPQCIDNEDARERLGGIADAFLMHDRGIAHRVDDSVARVSSGTARLLRRARGYAPAPLRLHESFGGAPAVLAMGGVLKAAFCLLRGAEAIVSHHLGDLGEAATQADYRRSIQQYLRLFDHRPQYLAVDLHPEYLSRKHGQALAAEHGIGIAEVQHHHAHVAACLAENGVAADADPVIGIALDGLGYGADGTLWGGECLLADYRGFRRLATFKPVTMLGGERAVREPWRNTYAHVTAAMSWAEFAERYGGLELFRSLEARPRKLLDQMAASGIASPLASSCGRLFDAVAAALGLCREHVSYEGQAAAELEARVDEYTLREESDTLAYRFDIVRGPASGLLSVEPRPMWHALLRDLCESAFVPVISARFHKGLAITITKLAQQVSDETDCRPIRTIALSGGVLQNSVLSGELVMRLEQAGFNVLTHRQVPPNDGGLALGQAAVAAARAMEQYTHRATSHACA